MHPSSFILPIPLFAAFYLEEIGQLKSRFPGLYVTSSYSDLPKAFGYVFLSNIIIAGLCVVILGFKVGAARKKYREKAMKEQEKDAEVRFSLPNLYVEGNTENAKLFNCVQRGHQQCLETFTQFVTFSLVSGLRFPLATAFCGMIWSLSRLKWAAGYSKGDPAKRYEHMLGGGIWFSLIFVLLGALGTVSKMLLNI